MTCVQTNSYSVVVPLFFSESESFWLKKTGLDFIYTVVIEMKECRETGPVFVVTDSWKIASFLKEKKVGVELVSVSPGCDDGWLPRGSVTALEYLFGKDGRDMPCMLRDVRQQGVGCDAIHSMSDRYDRQADVIMTTLTVPRDHPCQLKQYYKSKAVGFVLPFDQSFDNGDSGHRVTIPFKAGLPETVSCGQLFDKDAFLCGRLETRADLTSERHANTVTLIAEGMGMGRLAFPRAVVDPEAAGFEVLGVMGFCTDLDIQAFLVRDTNEGGCFLRTANARGIGCDSVLLYMEDADLESTLPYEFHEMISIPPDMVGSGFFITLANKAQGGEFDIEVQFPSKEGLWRRTSTGMLNAKTGQLIHGRQGFPEVYTLDTGLVIGRVGALLEGATSFDHQCLSGHIIKENLSIANAFDLLRSKVDKEFVQQGERIAIAGLGDR